MKKPAASSLALVALGLTVSIALSGCQAIRQWRAKADAAGGERLARLEKQVEVLTAKLDEVDLEMRFNVAANQVSLGKYDQAIKWFMEIVRRDPNSKYAADSLYESAKIYKYNLKDYHRAIAAYEELMKRYPKSEFIKTASYEIAECLGELGKKSDALEQYRRIIAKYGKEPVVEKAYFDIGELYQDERKYQQARETYEKLMDVFPGGANTSAALYRVALCAIALSDTPAALRDYERVYTEFASSDFAELAVFGRISALYADNSDSDARDLIGRYIVRYPGGRFRAEVERFLSKLDRRKPAAP